MKTRELILVLVIIGYVLSVLFYLALEYNVEFENNKDRPMQMVELFGNGTSRSYEIEPSPLPAPSIFFGILAAGMKLAFALPYVIAGIGMWGMAIVFVNPAHPVQPEIFHQWILFFIPSMISIPINYMFTKDIPLWRRIPYIYLLVAIISGTPVLLSSNFGQ